MITTANETTKKAHEILAASQRALLVTSEECQVGLFETSGVLTLSGFKLVSVLPTSRTIGSSVLIEVETNRASYLEAGCGWSRFVLLLPSDCAGKPDVSRQ